MRIKIASLLSRCTSNHLVFAVAVISHANFDGLLGIAHMRKDFLLVRMPDEHFIIPRLTRVSRVSVAQTTRASSVPCLGAVLVLGLWHAKTSKS